MRYTLVDFLFLFSLVSIWILLLVNIILALAGYRYYLNINKAGYIASVDEHPTVSIMVPCHNEVKVIARTVKAILALNYPKERMELIVINDNSSDNTSTILLDIKTKYPEYNFTIINTNKANGGKGKSNALNIGFQHCKSEYIAVYDADNTPNKNALIYLVERIYKDNSLGAVIGKFRTRNRNRNLLTRFINIETLSFQWMAQAGRWQLLKLCTIPGTNFIIRRKLIDEMGGWDTKAIAEDTEISFRLYRMGYRIAFMPLSETYEQEPETLKVWFKQRTRWAKGNVYVLIKNMRTIFKKSSRNIRFDLLYFFSVYFFFLSSVVLSDIIFLLSLFGLVKINVQANFLVLWLLAYILFILEISITLTLERGESTLGNISIIALMYFTYCQLWLIVAVNGIFQYIKDSVLKKEAKWYKTERF